MVSDVKGCLPQILLGRLLNTLSHISDQQKEIFRKYLRGIVIILRKIEDDVPTIWFSLKCWDDKNFENQWPISQVDQRYFTKESVVFV